MLVATIDDRTNICLAWNTVYQHVYSGIFNIETKLCAIYLLSHGYDLRFLKALAGGNLLVPENVIEIALLFDGLDKMKSKKGGLL